MTHTITVTPDDGTAAGWIIHCWKMQNGVHRAPKPIPLVLAPDDGGAFTGNLDLNDGIYAFDCDLMTGVSLTIGLDPEEKIIQPNGATWPVTAKLAGTATGGIKSWYFEVGTATAMVARAARARKRKAGKR